MEFVRNSFQEALESPVDTGMPLFAGNGITVECYNLKKASSLIVSNELPEYQQGEPRTICYVVLSGLLEIWFGEEKLRVKAGSSLTLYPRENFSVWAVEDAFFYAIHNKVEPEVNEGPAKLVQDVNNLERKDAYLSGHNYRVGKYSTLIMQILAPERATVTYHLAAAFHDVGKLVVAEEILNKAGKLTDAEFLEIQKHPAASYEILREFLGDTVAGFSRWHHEKLDGSGYPDGLHGEAIPLESRVMAVADIFDALTTARCYRSAFSFEKAIAIMKEDAQKGKIDPLALSVLEGLIAAGKIVDGVDNYVTVRQRGKGSKQ